MSLEHPLSRLAAGHHLTADECHAAISTVMDGQASEVEIAALLTALRIKGETTDEIVGAARAMRERVQRIPLDDSASAAAEHLLDTCGTGGDELHTFNISTATAFVAVAAGIKVAKHGNRGVSSKSGSADVLEQLGVNVNLSATAIAQCVREVGIGFCFAPLLHGAMKHAAPVRKQLKFRTIFNLLGPLTNPACAQFQLIGASRVTVAEKLAGALARLGTRHALVVCGADQLDEVSLWGETTVFEVRQGQVERQHWTAARLQLPECDVQTLRVDTPAESAALIRRVFAGEPGPARDIVLANATAALLAADAAPDLSSARQLAEETLKSGKAAEVLCQLAALSHQLA